MRIPAKVGGTIAQERGQAENWEPNVPLAGTKCARRDSRLAKNQLQRRTSGGSTDSGHLFAAAEPRVIAEAVFPELRLRFIVGCKLLTGRQSKFAQL
jgi:hypothetical protein